MAKRSDSRRELKKIIKIRTKLSKKHEYSISSIYISYSYSFLYSDSDLYERRQHSERKYMKKLDHVVTNNIKNKNQCDDTIEYEPIFDNKFGLSSVTKDPLPVVTVSLKVVNKHRANIISGLTYLWDSRATDSLIKR